MIYQSDPRKIAESIVTEDDIITEDWRKAVGGAVLGAGLAAGGVLGLRGGVTPAAAASANNPIQHSSYQQVENQRAGEAIGDSIQINGNTFTVTGVSRIGSAALSSYHDQRMGENRARRDALAKLSQKFGYDFSKANLKVIDQQNDGTTVQITYQGEVPQGAAEGRDKSGEMITESLPSDAFPSDVPTSDHFVSDTAAQDTYGSPEEIAARDAERDAGQVSPEEYQATMDRCIEALQQEFDLGLPTDPDIAVEHSQLDEDTFWWAMNEAVKHGIFKYENGMIIRSS